MMINLVLNVEYYKDDDTVSVEYYKDDHKFSLGCAVL